MLYGIAAVVIAAIIFLIVYNVRALRTDKPVREAPPKARKTEAKPSADNPPPPPRPAAATPRAEPDRAGDRAPAAEAQPPKETVRPAPQPAAGAVRSTPASVHRQQQSDNDYREALRSFRGGESAGEEVKEKSEESGKTGKDIAYREGLRSLTKRDET